MKAIVRYILLTASRDFLFLGLFVMIIAAYGFSLFTGSTALVEQQQMTVAYFAGTSRVILIMGLVTFICFHIRRAFENREIETILSKPLSRVQFVLAYWIGYVVLVLLAALSPILIFLVLGGVDSMGLLYWGSSLLLEASLMMAFALVAALVLRSAVTALFSVAAFYLVARLMGFLMVAIDNPNALLHGLGWQADLMVVVLKIVSVTCPRFD